MTTFILLWGVPPFHEAHTGCWYFRCAANRRWGRFWQQHEAARPGHPALSPGAKAFLERGLVPDPFERPCAEEMRKDPWLGNSEDVCGDLAAFMAANQI